MLFFLVLVKLVVNKLIIFGFDFLSWVSSVLLMLFFFFKIVVILFIVVVDKGIVFWKWFINNILVKVV